MANGNNITIVGNVTRDPEIRYTAERRRPKATFGVAVSRRWQNRQTQEWEEHTCFFNVVCWREMAENVAESLAKGTRVIVTGRLEQRSLGDRERREAQRGRDRRRRDRPEPALGDRRRSPRTTARGGGDFEWRRRAVASGGGGGGGGGGRPRPGRRWRPGGAATTTFGEEPF